jgi:hypothetical protein
VPAAFAAVVLSAAGALTWTLLDTGDGSYRRGELKILTGGTQGVYYGYGLQLAHAINSRLDGVEASAVVTTASVENLRRVSAEPNVFAFTAADAASAAVSGRTPFSKPEPVRAVARIYDEYIHLVVRKDAPIRTIADLRKRRVSIGLNGSGTELIADRLFDVAPDIDLSDVTVSRLGINGSVSALQAGTIDAFFWQGGLPTSGVAELAKQLPIRLVPLDGLADALREQPWDPAYRRGTVPQGTYGGVDETPTIAVPDLLVTRADTDAGLVRQVTRILFEARAELAAAVPVGYALDRRSAIATSPVPLHDGALRYYRETKV